MYMIDNMIDMGLEENEKWTSDAHRVVAQHVAILNPRITSKQKLMDTCSAINKIPENEIKKVTAEDLIGKYAVPNLSFN